MKFDPLRKDRCIGTSVTLISSRSEFSAVRAMEEKYDEAKLLECFDPVLSWAETPCLMRTWRPIRGEGMELDDLVSDALKADGISEEEFGRRKYELRSFDVGRLLGEGNYTQVFCATLRCTQEEYAFKIVDKAKVSELIDPCQHPTTQCSHGHAKH